MQSPHLVLAVVGLALAIFAPAARAQDAPAEIALTVAGTERRAFLVNVPPKGERRPAVIILHGGMGNAADMRTRTGFDQLARANGFIAAYGEGT